MLKETKNKLGNRLLYLPLDPIEKVLLWLTYRRHKSVSEISVTRRNRSKTKKQATTFDECSTKIQKIKNWIKDSGMVYKPEKEYPSAWHVGHNKKDVSDSATTIRKFDYDSELKTGLLFGFPIKSVQAYATNSDSKTNNKSVAIIWPGDKYLHPKTKDESYTPYLLYAVNLESSDIDLKVAENWANCIRTELPTLAKWYEKKELIRKQKENTNPSSSSTKSPPKK